MHVDFLFEFAVNVDERLTAEVDVEVEGRLGPGVAAIGIETESQIRCAIFFLCIKELHMAI